MILPSRLATTTLGDLLGRLHRQRTTGALELVELWTPPGSEPKTHRIHLFCGLVTGVTTARSAPPLGELLVREGFLGVTAHLALLRKLGGGDPRRSGEILVAERMAAPELVEAALRAQIRMKLEGLFQIEDAAVAFRTARPLGAAARRIVPLGPDDFLHGRPRARDGGPESGVRPREKANSGAGPFRPEEPIPSQQVRGPDEARRRALRQLGLSESASEADVRRAFRRLAIELHPDRHVKAPAEERDRKAARFAELSAAYHALVA